MFLEQGNFRNMHEFHTSANIHSLLPIHERGILSCIIYIEYDLCPFLAHKQKLLIAL